MPPLASPTLSVCCMTADPPAQVAESLAALRPVADEVVVAVDSRVEVRALAAYDDVADRVVRFEFRPPVDRPRAWLAAQCSGDWLLSIDGDEVPSAALVDALPHLVAATDVQQCWLPRRWLWPDAATWLAEAPWWPDFQVRLLRNDAMLASRAELHGGFVGVLPARHVDAPLYHLDTVVNDEATPGCEGREVRGRGARARRGYGGGPLSDVMYRPEAWSSSGAVRPVPDEDRALIERVLAARARALTGPPTPVRPTRPGDQTDVPLAVAADVDGLASSPAMAPGDYAAGLSLFETTEASAPLRLAPGEARPVYVEVENQGGATWRWGLDQQPLVRLSHHWLAPDGALTRYEGLRSPLPCTLPPGASVIMPMWVEAPEEPGEHVLEIDLVHELVRWFERPLRVPVVVAERRPAAAEPESGPARPGGTSPC